MGPVYDALCLTLLGAIGTALGGALVIIQPSINFKRLGSLQGIAAGLMLYISIVDLLTDSITNIGYLKANISFFLGAIFIALIVLYIPDPNLDDMIKLDDNGDEKTKDSSRDKRKKVLFSGLMTALGIFIHNFPEGVSVFLASLKSRSMGFNLAFAIALHNIPEGVAVALPVYFATQSKWEGFKYAALSGLAEPLAVITLGILSPIQFIKDFVEYVMAGVGGIMAFITFHELLPLSIEHCGKTQACISLFIGMAIMAMNFYLLEEVFKIQH